MALDIHKLENGKAGDLLFKITNSLYVELEPSFELFKKRTGLFIDPYGDLEFSSGLGTLIDVICEYSKNLSVKKQKNYNTFLSLLNEWEQNKTHVIFLGD